MPSPRKTGLPPTSRSNPHIRLNSNPNDLLAQDTLNITRTRDSSNQQPSARRSLIPSGRSSRQSSGGSTSDDLRRIGSSEHLLPPKPQTKQKRYRDVPSRSPSPASSVASSRRSSFESGYGPFADPFDSGSSRSHSFDDGDLNTQTVAQKFNITPSEGLILYPHDVEKDDYLHNPQPGEKETRECGLFTRRGVINLGGLAFITIGVSILFIIWPVLYDLPFLVRLRLSADRLTGRSSIGPCIPRARTIAHWILIVYGTMCPFCRMCAQVLSTPRRHHPPTHEHHEQVQRKILWYVLSTV